MDVRQAPARSLALTLVCALLVACSAEQPVGSADPSAVAPGVTPRPVIDSPAPGATQPPDSTPDSAPDSTPDSPPRATLDPAATPRPLPERLPLPEPELDDPTEIGEAILEPATRAQGVVSMLRGLGIGIYHRDGSPIRAGDERGRTDPWLYEDEVYALIDMAGLEWRANSISFADWHTGLRELGLQMSAGDLAAAYDEVYFYELNESFFVELITALGVYFDPDYVSETQFSRLQAWLLLMDGFVVGAGDTVGGGRAMANVGPIHVAQNHDEEKWGGASSKIPRIVNDSDLPLDLPAAAARLETLTRSVRLVLTPDTSEVHEGHGREGSPVDLQLYFQPYAVAGLAPFGDDFFLQPNPNPEGLPVRWEAATGSVLAEHGELRDHNGADPLGAPTLTRSDGSAALTYTPRSEEANGEGTIASDAVLITALADVHEVARRTWFVPDVLLGWLQASGGVMRAATGAVPLDVASGARLSIEWHELRGLSINMTDDYDVSFDFPKVRGAEMSLGQVRRIGTDHFEGFLAEQEDGTWRGIVRGATDSQWRETFPNDSCSTGIAGSQELLATAELTEYQRPGEGGVAIVLRFFPISPPEISQIGCDWQLNRWTGPDPDDPFAGAAAEVPAEYYAPFNDQRIIRPLEVGFPTSMPDDPGSLTHTYDEHAPGIGGGTFRVTIEVVEPPRR